MLDSNGSTAEQVAAHCLARKHYRILARNYHCAHGELDIVCLDGDTLVFCEVKQRSAGLQSALLSVSQRKRAKLVAAASRYIAANPHLDGLMTRFDVVTVTPAGEQWRVHHLPDAFRPED